MERAKKLGDRQRYRLIELLDPDISHYEFFLSRPPLSMTSWQDDTELLQAVPERHPCMEGWPSQSVFNYDYQITKLSQSEFEFLQACDQNQAQATVEQLVQKLATPLETVRRLQSQQLIMLK